jgi:hypothetical protein
MKKFSRIIESSQYEKYSEVIDSIKEMIEATIENSGGEYQTFIESFIKSPEDVKIEGLINDSDIWDFFLKYRNQIDEILNEIKFFTNSPEENNFFGLYDYVIGGTQKSIEEFVKILSDSDNKQPTL